MLTAFNTETYRYTRGRGVRVTRVWLIFVANLRHWRIVCPSARLMNAIHHQLNKTFQVYYAKHLNRICILKRTNSLVRISYVSVNFRCRSIAFGQLLYTVLHSQSNTLWRSVHMIYFSNHFFNFRFFFSYFKIDRSRFEIRFFCKFIHTRIVKKTTEINEFVSKIVIIFLHRTTNHFETKSFW